jgi:hypothetical protein
VKYKRINESRGVNEIPQSKLRASKSAGSVSL